MNARPCFATIALLLPVGAALAQADAAILHQADVVITGSLRAKRTLEAPFAMSNMDSHALRWTGSMIKLSEGLAGVLGLVVAEDGLMLGMAQERQRDDRRGRENFVTSAGVTPLGVSGALRRDEVNRARTRDVYAQLEWPVAATLTARLEARSGRVEITVEDRFAPFTPTIQDDVALVSVRSEARW